MSFHESATFPEKIAAGSERISRFNTRVFMHDNGASTRIAGWSQPLLSFDVSRGLDFQEDVAELERFWRARRGATFGFRFKDWWDYHTNPTGTTHNPGDYTDSTDQLTYSKGRLLPVEDSLSGGLYYAAQLCKLYDDAGVEEYRVINKPRSGAVISGLTYSGIDTTTGIVSTANGWSEASILNAKWRGQFDVPCHFSANIDNQGLSLSAQDFNANSVPSVEIYEIRAEFETPSAAYAGGSYDFGASANTLLTTSSANGRFQVFRPSSGSTVTVVILSLSKEPAGEGILVLHNAGDGTLSVRTSYVDGSPTSVASGETARVHIVRDYVSGSYESFITVS
jgi:uncharacterized protein (TIGR02217 family)